MGDIISKLASDKNKQIVQISELCLSLIVDHADDGYADAIRQKRFEQHNFEWIQFIESLTETHNAAHIIRPLSQTELMMIGNDDNMDESEDDYFGDMDDMHMMTEFSDDESVSNLDVVEDEEEMDENDKEAQRIINDMHRLSMFT